MKLLAMAGHWIFYLFLMGWLLAGWFTNKTVEKLSGPNKEYRLLHILVFVSALFVNSINLPYTWGGRLLFPDPTFLIVIGFLFIVFGVIFAIWARVYLGQHWSGAIQLREGQRIVQTGPYRYVRHPIYSGILFSFIGLFLIHPQWLGLITLLLLFASYHRKMKLEESFLVRHFGHEYEQYKQKTSRVIPFIY